MRVTVPLQKLLVSLGLLPLSGGQRTLQSLTTSSPPREETTTTLPWPTLTLEDFSPSPTDSWSFKLHRPPKPPPSSDSHPASPRVSIEAVPLMEIPSPSLGPKSSSIGSLIPPRPRGPPPQYPRLPESPNPEELPLPTRSPLYRRYEVPPLPSSSEVGQNQDETDLDLEEAEPMEESRLVPVVEERNHPKKQPRLQLVSLPRIYADMAFAGNQDRVAVPRRSIRRPTKSLHGAVRLLLPRSLIQKPYAQERGDEGQQGTLIIPAHMIVAGVEAVGQSKLAEERISDDLDDRQDSGLLGPLQRSLNYMRTTFRYLLSFLSFGDRKLFEPEEPFSGPLYRPHGRFPRPYPTTSPTRTPKDKRRRVGGFRTSFIPHPDSIADKIRRPQRHKKRLPASIRDKLSKRRLLFGNKKTRMKSLRTEGGLPGQKKRSRPEKIKDSLFSRRLLSGHEGGTPPDRGSAERLGAQDILKTISELGKELSELEDEVVAGNKTNGSKQLRETISHLKDEIVGYERQLDRWERENIATKESAKRSRSEQSLAEEISYLEKEIAEHEARLAKRPRPGVATSIGTTLSRLRRKLNWYVQRLTGRSRRTHNDRELAQKISKVEKEISWHEKRPLANVMSKLDNEITWHEGRRKIVPDRRTQDRVSRNPLMLRNGHSYGYTKNRGPFTWITSLLGGRSTPQEKLAESISELETEIGWHEARLGGKRPAEERFSTGGTRENLASSIYKLEKEIEWHEEVQDLEEEIRKHEQRVGERSSSSQNPGRKRLSQSLALLEDEVELQEQVHRLEDEIGWHEKRLAGKSRSGNSQRVITEVPETWTFSKRRGEASESDNTDERRQTAISEKTKGGEPGKITRSNFWKLPHFATSTDTDKGRAFNWVGPGSRGTETRLHVPGRGGPLVWGDMEGRLEKLQSDYIASNPSKLSTFAREP